MPVVFSTGPGRTRVHHEAVVAREAHGRGARDVLHTGWLFGIFLKGHYGVTAPAFEVTNLVRVTVLAVEHVGSLFGQRRI